MCFQFTSLNKYLFFILKLHTTKPSPLLYEIEKKQNVVLEILANKMRQEKDLKGVKTEDEEMKLHDPIFKTI